MQILNKQSILINVLAEHEKAGCDPTVRLAMNVKPFLVRHTLLIQMAQTRHLHAFSQAGTCPLLRRK